MEFKQNEELTYYEVLERASSFLIELGHSSFVSEWLMRERLGWNKTELVMHYRKPMPDILCSYAVFARATLGILLDIFNNRCRYVTSSHFFDAKARARIPL